MPKLSIIVGMAGSGKTWFCEQIANQSTPKAVTFPDATLICNDDNRRAGHRTLGEMVARLLGRSEDCVMDESHLTVPIFRDKFKSFCDTFLPGIQQDWIFFEANVVACINNVYHDAHANNRSDLSRFKALENQRKIYRVPDESEWPGRQVQRVYQRGNPQFDASSELDAVAWLQAEISKLSTHY